MKKLLASALIGLVGTGCAAGPTDPPAIAANQANILEDELKLPPVLNDVVDYAKTGYALMQFLIGDEEEKLTNNDLLNLRNRVGVLEQQMEELKKQAALIAARVDALATETRSRFVSDKYQLIKSALETVAEHPDRQPIAENDLLIAANSLAQDSYYMFKDTPRPDRFDPRFATPTFVLAVTTWLAVRSDAKVPMSLVSRDILRGWADKLAWVASTSQASVTCHTEQERLDEPCDNGRDSCEKHFCYRATFCYDAIRQTQETFDISKTAYNPATCQAINQNAPDKARTLYEQRYRPEEYAQLAEAWRDYATQTNLALNRPAVQWPEPDPSTWWFSPAGRAVDGNTDGNWYDGSVTHTDIAPGAWWTVDLGSVQHIRQIKIFNRTDCCSSRLSHYLIQSSTDSTNAYDGNWPTQLDQSGAEFADGDGTPITLNVDFNARWVAVTKADSNYLSLAEVQVFGF